jgi:hypothetical protein
VPDTILTFRPAKTVGVWGLPWLESCDLNGIPINTTAIKAKERQMTKRRIDIAPSFCAASEGGLSSKKGEPFRAAWSFREGRMNWIARNYGMTLAHEDGSIRPNESILRYGLIRRIEKTIAPG